MSLGIELSPPGNGSQRVTLSGRLDTHTYEDLDEALAPLLTAPASKWVRARK